MASTQIWECICSRLVSGSFIICLEQIFVELAEKFAANPVPQDPKEESKDPTIGSSRKEWRVDLTTHRQKQPPGVKPPEEYDPDMGEAMCEWYDLCD